MDSMDHQDLATIVQRMANEVLPAVHGDIRRLDAATQRIEGDIRSLDAKLDDSVRRLAMGIVGVDSKIDAQIHALDTKLTSKLDHVLSVVQSFAGKLDRYGSGQTLHGHVLTEAQIQLKDHERRIKSLEDRPQ